MLKIMFIVSNEEEIRILKGRLMTVCLFVHTADQPGTDLGGFQGAEGTPWASQGVPGTPCGFCQEEF